MIVAARHPWFYALLTASSVLVATAGAAATEPPSYAIGPGDILEIAIHAGGDEQESFNAEVSDSGRITIPLLGEVTLAGLAPAEASQRLTEALSQGYYVNPQAIVSVKEYAAKVYLVGEVRRPGAYNFRDAVSVLNACILAGGFSDYAAPNRAKVTRQREGRLQVFKIDLRKVQEGKKPDMFLQPGDRIEVPRRRF